MAKIEKGYSPINSLTIEYSVHGHDDQSRQELFILTNAIKWGKYCWSLEEIKKTIN